MPKEKVNYQEVYDLYQLCSETKNLKEFCSEYGINYDKFMNWQRHQLWDEKLGKTVEVKQPDTAPIQIVGTPDNQPIVKIQPVKPAVPESIKWVKIQLTSGVNILGTESSKLLAQMGNVLKTLTDEAFINFAKSCGYELKKKDKGKDKN